MDKLKLLAAALIVACAAPAWAAGIGKGVGLKDTQVGDMCFVSLPFEALRHNSMPTKPCWAEN